MSKILIIKKIILYLNYPRFTIHILLYFFSNNKTYIKSDIKRNLEHHDVILNAISGLVFLLTFDKYFRNLFYYRIGHLKYICKWIAKPHPSFDIGTYTQIAKGFLVVHPFSTIINAISIGENCIMKNDVTIGSNNGLPLIKNNVEINVGSIIIGDITIGNNVVIGAGSVITKSVPDNCTVIGNPAYIIKINGHKVRELL